MKRYILLISLLILPLAFITSYAYKNYMDKPHELSGTEIKNYFVIEDKEDNKNDEPNNETIIITTPDKKLLSNDYHIYQTFNNCGPASLSMALSYYGINASQEKLGYELRPYQNPKGDNDDKSVTLQELAEKSKEYGLIPFHRPNGNLELIQKFISQDMPVITRTWLKKNEDIGHYRVIKGYNKATQEIIQDDSLQGKNLVYKYTDFDSLWKKFNYEYLVLVPEDKVDIVKEILSENYNERTSWETAANNAKAALLKDPNDYTANFNLVVALYNTGMHSETVKEFERIQNKLSFRTLWYNIEPIKAYYELGNYSKVFEISDSIIENGNRAFSELYIVRGNSYLKLNQPDKAKQEFEKAVFYNKNLKIAQEELNKFK